VVNNPILCATIVILWLVAFPGFLTISTVLRIVNVVSLVVPATVVPYLRIIGAIIIAQWAQSSTDCKM